MSAKKLTTKQQKFVAAIVGPAKGNATEAAAMAGYTGPRTSLAVQGHDNLRNPNIQGALEKAMAQYSPEKVVRKIGEHADADYDDCITIHEDGSFHFDLIKIKAAGKTHLIRKLKHDAESGAPVIEMQDQAAALDRLAKIHGLYKDPDEKQGTTTNVNVKIQAVLSTMHPAAVAEFHRAMLAADIVDAEPSDQS